MGTFGDESSEQMRNVNEKQESPSVDTPSAMSTPDERDQRLVRQSSGRMQDGQTHTTNSSNNGPLSESTAPKLGDARPVETRHITGMTDMTAATSHSGRRSETHPHRRHHKIVERLPCLRAPAADPDGPWLKEGAAQSSWFSLFYDLALVAILTVFAGTHELTHPSAIPMFLSYFAILSWIWTSQCFYDIRYQAEDLFHRLMNSAHIISFIYIGAASGNWNLDTMKNPDRIEGISLEDGAKHLSAQDSFTTIAIAFIVSRGLLLLQYLVAIFLGRRVGRSILPLVISAASIFTGIISLIIAIVLPFNTDAQVGAKITLVYIPIVVELAGAWLQTRKRWHHRVSTEFIGERYGALTLIILGEGLITLTKSFSLAISGLSQSNTATYAQVFLAIIIIIMSFLYLFGRFKKEDTIHHSRAILWEAIHFPLHFFLLLLLAGMVNFIVTLSFTNGLGNVSQQLVDIVKSYTDTRQVSPTDVANLQNYIAKLQLQPPLQEMLEYIGEYTNTLTPELNPVILLNQYTGQIIIQTIGSYGIHLESHTFDLYVELLALNATIDYSAENVIQSAYDSSQASSHLVFELLNEPTNEALSGILWLFPTAGAVLILAAIRSMVWYRFVGVAHWIIHAPMLFSGTALALLGVLDVGDTTVHFDAEGLHLGDSPIIALIYESLPLVIIMLVYVYTYWVSLMLMRWMNKKKGGVYANPKESTWVV